MPSAVAFTPSTSSALGSSREDKAPTNLNNGSPYTPATRTSCGRNSSSRESCARSADYEEQLSIVVLYRFDPTVPERIADVQVVAHETWRSARRPGLGDSRVHRFGTANRRGREGAGEFVGEGVL